MTDSPSPKQPSDEALPPSEDETRFAPRENGEEHKDGTSAPAAKKRLKTSLDVVSEHAAEEESARQEDAERKARGDALFWNLCLGLFALIVIGAGYIVYEKFSQLPDPVKDAREALEANHSQLLKKQVQLMEIRNRTAPKEQLLGLLDIFEHTASDLEETQKSIEKEKMRVAGIRGEIRSYFERYRQDARAKARGRKFDILRTSHSGKTYLNVEITRVENEFVRIMHEPGEHLHSGRRPPGRHPGNAGLRRPPEHHGHEPDGRLPSGPRDPPGAFSGSGSLPRSTVPQKESGGGGPGPARRKAAN